MTESKLLSGLPAAERERLRPYLKTVQLEFDQALVEFDQPIRHVYFLESAVTSTVVRTPDGDTIEVGLMGAEGFVGLSLLYGVASSNATVLVQLPGTAARMRAADFERHVRAAGGPCLELLLRYANFFGVMVQQHAACNAAHSITARLSRWMLLTHDRVEGDEFSLTQEYLARMLGVRRPTVSVIAAELRDKRMIDYRRGRLCVTDRALLESHACECYGLVREQVARTFQTDGKPR